MSLFDRVALLLWRDRDGYEPELGRVGDRHNVSVLTRLRSFKRWFVKAWGANWKWWVTTFIACAAVAATIAPLYMNLPKPAEQMNAHAWELALRCVEQGKCIVRIEPVSKDKDQVIAAPKGNGSNAQRAASAAKP